MAGAAPRRTNKHRDQAIAVDTEVTLYTGIIALAVNLIVVVVGSFVLRAIGAPAGEDVTRSEDFEVEAGDPNLRPLPGTPGQEEAATT